MIKTWLTLLISIPTFANLSPAHAASSPWQDLGGGKVRLVANKDPSTNIIEGLIEVQLEPGWNTYWRSPGNSGIPPEFDFSGSTFFQLGEVKFPTPYWIELADTAFLGYRETVSFVFTAEAKDISASINLDMLIGVCEEICIPATASLSVSADALNSSDPRLAVALLLAKSKLPDPASAMDGAVEFALHDDAIAARITGGGKDSISRLVISSKSQWVSDPVEAKHDVEGNLTAIFKLPPGVASQDQSRQEWDYTLVRQSTDDGKVEAAFDGTFVTDGGRVEYQ